MFKKLRHSDSRLFWLGAASHHISSLRHLPTNVSHEIVLAFSVNGIYHSRRRPTKYRIYVPTNNHLTRFFRLQSSSSINSTVILQRQFSATLSTTCTSHQTRKWISLPVAPAEKACPSHVPQNKFLSILYHCWLETVWWRCPGRIYYINQKFETKIWRRITLIIR